MMNLELLDLSGNIHMESLPAMSSAGNLKMLVLDGCSSLEHVALEGAPPLLESFSFDGYGPAEKWTHPIQLPKEKLRPKSRTALVQEARVRRISLKGCARLHMFLHALPNLEEMDLSGTAVKSLDLSAMDIPQLKKVFLVGCEQLRSLTWTKRNRSLGVLHVDTRGKIASAIYSGEQMFSAYEVVMAFPDGRFIWSTINGLYRIIPSNTKVYLHISSTHQSQVNVTRGIKEIGPSSEGLVATGTFFPCNDIVLNRDIVTCSALLWDHRQLYPLGVHIEIGEGSHHLDSMNDNEAFRGFMEYKVESLHVHDNISVTTILSAAGKYWAHLEWSHIERCPKLHTAFPKWGGYSSFSSIKIFSASDLAVAYCIWGTCSEYHWHQFVVLQHIYLHNCPRLETSFPFPSHCQTWRPFRLHIVVTSNIFSH
ncbi:hypothetical protein VPH35_108966 [Triticum aestivum]|uniref:Uncharacterized protein n=1 Tax=Triticum turgidum subsp. durum TaxID=4567 RepID=A0A9R0YGK4_TRITD|nr:unnamed protein product [Triticum turgidum subsp. durum]